MSAVSLPRYFVRIGVICYESPDFYNRALLSCDAGFFVCGKAAWKFVKRRVQMVRKQANFQTTQPHAKKTSHPSSRAIWI